MTDVPGWHGAGELIAVLRRPHNVRRTVGIALVVGTILFCINQLDVVLRGGGSTTVWLKCALTYLVPFCVSNYGIAVATHRKA
ncbi:MAG TPA: nitrate/nitrite transporter NrtS [Candidatus Dormibacteraeota bacterium]|jgi:hypothetical protein|nr:nitrate/nitrite transporter NrtS [Candidatus Dormibacteraeota bacterium]